MALAVPFSLLHYLLFSDHEKGFVDSLIELHFCYKFHRQDDLTPPFS